MLLLAVSDMIDQNAFSSCGQLFMHTCVMISVQ
jgi:hypothetical protein